jgi:nucleotide-binding universal stress UspA family protein
VPPGTNAGALCTLKQIDRIGLSKNGHICSQAHFVFSKIVLGYGGSFPQARRKQDVQKSTALARMIEENETLAALLFGEEIVMPETHAFPSIPTKILLPIDFSPSSQAALDMAGDLAQHFHAELHLVNVIPFFPTTTLRDFVPEESFLLAARTYAEQHLAKCHAALVARGIKASSSVEVGNDVAGTIMEVVEREHIDMVVISTHGISGWHPMIFGSIAEKVVKLVQCPLLLLRSAKPEASVSIPPGRASE